MKISDEMVERANGAYWEAGPNPVIGKHSRSRMRVALEAARLSDPLIRPGDQLQSSASRLAEFVMALDQAPYEVRMAALEAQSAVDAWTEVRR